MRSGPLFGGEIADHEMPKEDLSFSGDGITERKSGTVPEGLLRRDQGRPGAFGEACRPVEGVVNKTLSRQDGVEPSHAECFISIERSAGKNNFGRDARSDESGKANSRAAPPV